MENKTPKNIDEYKKWLKEEHDIEISDRIQKRYESVTNTIKLNFEKSDLWVQLTENLTEYNDEYLIITEYPLLIPRFKPELNIKLFDSFLLKTFRKNIIDNKRWPDKPENGWIFPNNWYSRINDIIRTLLVVKYIDGVEFMINKVRSLCKQHHSDCKVFLPATEEGYYAAHLYTKQRFEIPPVTFDTEKVDVSIEIQITTQLQEIIRRQIHKYYEDRRKRTTKEDTKWQWNYESDEFRTNYLGHILHYIEGMIIEVREKQKQKEKII